MANSKSAEKRIRQNEKRRQRNRVFRSRARTHVKQARELIEDGDLDAAETEAHAACKALDRAAAKGIIHRNNAARRMSRLMKSINRARASASG